MVTHQLQVERRTGKVRRPETDFLPLCHATNSSNVTAHQNKVSPRRRRRRDDMPRWQKSTSVHGRARSPDISGGRRGLSCRQPACLKPRQLRYGTERRTDRRTERAISKCPLLGGGQAASVPIAQAAALRDRQTDGTRDSKMGGGIITQHNVSVLSFLRQLST